MEFTTTKRGHPSLICNGYRYTKKRENRSGEVVWCCVARPYRGKVITNSSQLIKEESHECVPDVASIDVHKAMSQAKKRAREEYVLHRCTLKSCCAVIITDSEGTVILEERGQHNHLSDFSKVERHELREMCKKRAAEYPNERPNTIIRSELSKSENVEELTHKDMKRCRQAMYCIRRKLTPVRPRNITQAIEQVVERQNEITHDGEKFLFVNEEAKIIVLTCATNISRIHFERGQAVEVIFEGAVFELGMGENEKETSATTCRVPWPAYGRFYELTGVEGNNYEFLCKLCKIKPKFIHANRSSTANLKKHIKTKHPLCLDDLEKEKDKRKRKRDSDVSIGPEEKKQHNNGNTSSRVTQTALDQAVMDFVIQETQPFRIVEQSSFISLVKLGLPATLKVMCSKTLKEKLKKWSKTKRMKSLPPRFAESEGSSSGTVITRREDRSPSKHSLICSCHFVNGDKSKGPSIFTRNADKYVRFTSPEKKKRKYRESEETGAIDTGELVLKCEVEMNEDAETMDESPVLDECFTQPDAGISEVRIRSVKDEMIPPAEEEVVELNQVFVESECDQNVVDENLSVDDDDDTFCQNVARVLKSLSLENKVTVKTKIQQLLFNIQYSPESENHDPLTVDEPITGNVSASSTETQTSSVERNVVEPIVVPSAPKIQSNISIVRIDTIFPSASVVPVSNSLQNSSRCRPSVRQVNSSAYDNFVSDLQAENSARHLILSRDELRFSQEVMSYIKRLPSSKEDVVKTKIKELVSHLAFRETLEQNEKSLCHSAKSIHHAPTFQAATVQVQNSFQL